MRIDSLIFLNLSLFVLCEYMLFKNLKPKKKKKKKNGKGKDRKRTYMMMN